MMGKKQHELIDEAHIASQRAFNHLSGFAVGAAILTKSGRTYSGCNVEFDNYSNTIHAEESAIAQMIAAGEKDITTIAVWVSEGKPCFPCGMCRQSLFEIGGPGLLVIAASNEGTKSAQMKTLLPHGFRLDRKRSL